MLNDGTMNSNVDLGDDYDYLSDLTGIDTTHLSHPITTIVAANFGTIGSQHVPWHAQSTSLGALNISKSTSQRSPSSPSTQPLLSSSDQFPTPASIQLLAPSLTNKVNQAEPHIERLSQPLQTSHNVLGDMAGLLAHAPRVWQSFERA